MGTNRRRLEREEARAREATERARREARDAARAEALKIVQQWNDTVAAGGQTWFSPTIGAARITGYTWLTVFCPGCRTEREVELSRFDRHPEASLSSLIPALSCTSCGPHPPFVQLRWLSPARPELPLVSDG